MGNPGAWSKCGGDRGGARGGRNGDPAWQRLCLWRDAPEDFGPHQPQTAQNPLGRVRIALEAALRASGVQVIILRAGDFLDTEASGNWFDMQMAPSLAKGRLTYPGDPDAAHAWAFLPDMARAAVGLANKRHDLAQVTDVAFPGYTLTGRELAALCGAALGRDVKVKRMAWWPIRMARPFWRMAAPLLEMRYLWDKPHHLCVKALTWCCPGSGNPASQAVARAVAAVLKTPKEPPTPARAAPRPAGAH